MNGKPERLDCPRAWTVGGGEPGLSSPERLDSGSSRGWTLALVWLVLTVCCVGAWLIGWVALKGVFD